MAKVLSGPGPLLLIWANAYNSRITAGDAPLKASKHAVHEMLTKGTLHDLHSIAYADAIPTDPGAPAGFNFNPGQLFPIDGTVNFQLIQTQLEVALTVARANIIAGVIVLVVFIIADLIAELINVFSGKPRALDTQIIGTRLTHGENPAAFILGTLILRELQQNNLVLSSSDPNDQRLIGQMRDQAKDMLVVQGLTDAKATQLIDDVFNHTTDENQPLPPELKHIPQPQQPPPSTNPDPVTCAQVQQAAGTIADAVRASVPAPPIVNIPPPIDVRPNLDAIATAIGKGTGAEDFDTRPNIDALTAAIKDQQPSDAVYKSILDQMVADGVIDGPTGQLLGDKVLVHIRPDHIHPLIRRLLSADPSKLPSAASEFWSVLSSLLKPWVAELEARGNTVLTDLEPLVTKYAPAIASGAKRVLADLGTVETTVPKDIFDFVVAAVTAGEQVSPDNVEDFAFRMLGAAFIVGQGLHLLAALAGYLGYPMSSIWGNNVRLIVDLLAFDEIRSALHDAFFPAAIHEAARQRYNRQFRTRAIPAQLAGTIAARRIAGDELLDEMAAFDGIRKDLVPFLQQLKFRPVSPRIISNAFINQDYPKDKMRSILERNQYRDDDVALINDALEHKAIAQLTNSYMTEVMDAWAEGAIGDQDVNDAITAAGWGSAARALVTKRQAIIRQRNLIKETLANYKASVYDGQITPEQFRSFLEATGAQPWKVDLEFGFAQTRAALKAFVKAQALAAKELTAQQKALERSYLAEYQQGNLTTAELTAALLTIPLEPGHVAALVTNAQTTQIGKSHYLFGKLLSPAQAETLRLLVAALKKQFTDTLIDAPAFLTALESAGIDHKDATEIVAAAAAGVVSSKKGSQKLPL